MVTFALLLRPSTTPLETLLRAIARGEFNISGLNNKTLRRHLQDKNSGQVSRLLKRLRVHGMVKKVGHTYKYYLTQFGKDVIATGLKLRELVVIPELAFGDHVLTELRQVVL